MDIIYYMDATLDIKLEWKRMMFRYAQTVRCSKQRPEIAMEAAQDEIRLKKEIEEMEAQQQQTAPIAA